MEKHDYHRILGISTRATAADIEASYLSLVEFLETAPGNLRAWTVEQTALIDEAYAALTESADEQPTPEPVLQASQQKKHPSYSRSSRRTNQPRGRPSRRPSDDYEDDDDAFDDDEVDEVDVVDFDDSRIHNNRPTWQQKGRRPRKDVVDDRYRSRSRRHRAQPGNPISKIAIGFGIGILVVIGLVATYQFQIAPFGEGTVDQSADRPIPINQTRYNQLVALAQANPQNFSAVFELGQMTFEAQRYDESISWLQKALAIKPDDVPSLLDVGTANFNLGDLEKARDMWLAARKVDPNNAQTHWNLGQYYANKQPPDIDSAIQEWQKVIQVANPNDQLYQLAQIHLGQYQDKAGAAAATPASQP